MSLFEIEVETAVSGVEAAKHDLVQAASQTLQQQGVALTILLTDDTAIQALNEQFRDEEKATDVLSFPAGEPMPGMHTYLGDIVISWPFAKQQAEAAGHSTEAEAQLLVVHGVLHLLGHDHAYANEKAAMWAAQTAVLQLLGLAHITPTESAHD